MAATSKAKTKKGRGSQSPGLFLVIQFAKGTQMDRPDFPTMEQVEKASHEQLARWYRFLPSGDTKEQQKVLDKIAEKFKKLGGMTPALEKKIGF
jgi:hypothetical protein